MQNLQVKIEQNSLTIRLPETIDPQAVANRIQLLIPLLSNLIAAEAAWLKLTDDEKESRMSAQGAADLMMQATLTVTVARAKLLVDIIEGAESIADHGFPEFSNGYNDEV